MAQAILLRGGGGVASDDVTASKAQVLQGYKTVTSDSDDEVIEGIIQVVDTSKNNYTITRATEYGLDKSRNAFYMHLPQRSAYYTRGDNIPHVEINADVLGNARPSQVLSNVTATSRNGVKFQGTFPVRSDADAKQEFWFLGDRDCYVTRIPEAAYMRYGSSESWDPWIRISRQIIKNAINYHPELTIDTVSTLTEQGQIPDRGESAGISYYQLREDSNGRLYVLFKNGWYHRAPWDDGQGHVHEAYLYVTYEQLKNLFGIDGSKMLQGYGIAGINGQIRSIDTSANNYTVNQAKNFGIDGNRGKFYMELGHGNAYYCREDNSPHVEVDSNRLGTAGADSILQGQTATSKHGLNFQGSIPRWISTAGDVITAFNGEGFVWDDIYIGRGRGINVI